MSLSPRSVLTLGGLRYDAHSARTRVSLGLLPDVSSLWAELPRSVEIDAAPGDPALLTFDGGEGSSNVFTGKLRTLRRSVRAVEAIASDSSGDVARYRSSVTFEDATAADIARLLAADAGAATGEIEADLAFAAYAAHSGCTAAEHIAAVAKLSGAIAFTNGEGALNLIPRPDRAEIALLFGRELLEIRESVGTPTAQQPYAIGSGPAGSTSEVTALRTSPTVLPSSAPPSGSSSRRISVGALRTPSGASSASEALARFVAVSCRRIVTQGFLVPTIRAGSVIEIHSAPNSISKGPWLVTRVVHDLQPRRGGRSRIEAVHAAGTLDLGAALSAAAGAAGSFL